MHTFADLIYCIFSASILKFHLFLNFLAKISGGGKIVLPVLDLPLCLGVLMHRPRWSGGPHLPKTLLRWIFAYVVQF